MGLAMCGVYKRVWMVQDCNAVLSIAGNVPLSSLCLVSTFTVPETSSCSLLLQNVQLHTFSPKFVTKQTSVLQFPACKQTTHPDAHKSLHIDSAPGGQLSAELTST